MDAPSDLVRRLRDRFVEAGYTIDGVRERLGDMAASALAREEIVPALRATRDADPLATLVRLWWLGAPVGTAAADLPLQGLHEAGLLVRLGDTVQATVHLQPWDAGTGDRRTSSPTARCGPAIRPCAPTTSSARAAPRPTSPSSVVRRRSAGPSTSAPAAASRRCTWRRHAGRVVATDVNPRALRLARAHAAACPA